MSCTGCVVMSAHTPGPWECIEHKPYRSYTVQNTGRQRVATVEHAEADARLIAASPDLLAALRAAADILETAGSGEPPLRQTCVRYAAAARAAITKATGNE